MPARRTQTKDFIFPGRPVVGKTAELQARTLTRALDRLVVTESDSVVGRFDAASRRAIISTTQDPLGATTGLAMTGVRAGAMVGRCGPGVMENDLSFASKLHVPLTVVESARLDGRGGTRGSVHEDCSSAFKLIAGSPQEAVDLPLIAIRIAEQALHPGICSDDCIQSPYDVATILTAEDDLLEAFLGRPDEQIDAVTPSQRMTLGARRRRVPVLISHRRPAGLNPGLTEAQEKLVVPGHVAFFSSHLGWIADDVFEDFGALTGRYYRPFSTYRLEDAEYVILTTGSAGVHLRQVIDHVRSTSRIRIGGLRIILHNPFPSEALKHALAGRRAVTVLDSGLFGEASLSRSVQSTMEGDDPAILTFANPGGMPPPTADWVGVIDNMTSSDRRKRQFYVVREARSGRARVPGLERTDQVLSTAYPDTPWINSRDPAVVRIDETGANIFGLQTTVMAEAAASLLKAYSLATGESVEGELRGGSPQSYEMHFGGRTRCTAVLDASLLREDAVIDRMTQESIVVVPSSSDKSQFWTGLPEAFRRAANERNLSVFAVEIPQDDSDAGQNELDDHLRAHRVLGAIVRSTLDGAIDFRELGDYLGKTLVQDGLPSKTASELAQAFSIGFQVSERISRSEAPARAPRAPETPWPLRDPPEPDGSVFDPARFWSSVGYENASGRTNLLAPDPYLSSRIVPARTSVVSARRGEELPQWLPENCTGCGLCWTLCPHSAMPVTVGSFSDFIEAGKARLESRGESATQVQRLGKHLAKRMHKLFAEDALNRFTSLRSLGEEAAAQLLEVAGLEGEAEQAAQSEFESLVAEIGAIKVARTESFFGAREQANKGGGRALSITIDPAACTACGICAHVCMDEAILHPITEAGVTDDLRAAMEVAASVPFDGDLRVETAAFPDRELAHRLIDKQAYYTTLGGGRASPGSGVRMTLHLITAIAETTSAANRKALASTVSDIEKKLKDGIQSVLSKSFEINDFDEFAKRLRGFDGASGVIKVEDLVSPSMKGTIDTGRLQRLSDSLLEVESLREQLDHGGAPASGVVVVFGDAPSLTSDAQFPLNPYSFPWINAGTGDAFAIAGGLSDGLTHEALAAVTVMRKARAVADDTFDPAVAAPVTLDSLTEPERCLLPAVCLVTETREGLKALSFGSQHPVRIFWLDSLQDPTANAEPLPVWHPDLCVTQTSPADASHFLSAIGDVFAHRACSITRIYAPEPERDGFPSGQTVARMTDAIAARVFPLFTYRPDASKEWTERWSLEGNPDAAELWASSDGIDVTPADWFAVEGRFASSFEALPRDSWNESHVPVEKYLSMDVSERNGLTPYVEMKGAGGRPRRLRVAANILDIAEALAANWRLLQEMAGIRSTLLNLARKQAEAALQTTLDEERSRLQSESDARIEELRASYEETLRQKLMTRLLTMSGFAGSPGTLAEWLANVEKQGRAAAESGEIDVGA